MIDGGHGFTSQKPPHDREQLRKRLLQMILKSEAERRGIHPLGPHPVQSLRTRNDVALAVYDPENLIEREPGTTAIQTKRT